MADAAGRSLGARQGGGDHALPRAAGVGARAGSADRAYPLRAHRARLHPDRRSRRPLHLHGHRLIRRQLVLPAARPLHHRPGAARRTRPRLPRRRALRRGKAVHGAPAAHPRVHLRRHARAIRQLPLPRPDRRPRPAPHRDAAQAVWPRECGRARRRRQRARPGAAQRRRRRRGGGDGGRRGGRHHLCGGRRGRARGGDGGGVRGGCGWVRRCERVWGVVVPPARSVYARVRVWPATHVSCREFDSAFSPPPDCRHKAGGSTLAARATTPLFWMALGWRLASLSLSHGPMRVAVGTLGGNLVRIST
mmetsp:Transcript_20403/g.61187  ORF Transcript_20403/g.61187 Transcript_20403/m.61187 type:complete len:306 (-) Transcript_20403:222-1139(-)